MKGVGMHPGRWAAMVIMLIGLPPAGVLLGGGSLAPYLEFPPRSRFIAHAPFSWSAFILISVFVLICIWPPIKSLAQRPTAGARQATSRRSLPWWGWGGLVLVAAAWFLAWTRFPWFTALQPHTFPMLWGAFILVVNGDTLRRSGTCLMTAHPLGFLSLFPASAGFWWVFEYLNRFVQNWYYTGADYPPMTYFLLATLSFATVLPAVLSVRQWLLSFPWLGGILRGKRLPARYTSPMAARGALAVSGMGLVLAGGAPNFGFPFLWLSPPAIVLAAQMLSGSCPLIDSARRGEWATVVAAALAGLFCGLFWELWNFHSLARWSYSVPFVDRFRLFEMPLLGYAGYLPFGLECILIGDMILGWRRHRRDPAR